MNSKRLWQMMGIEGILLLVLLPLVMFPPSGVANLLFLLIPVVWGWRRFYAGTFLPSTPYNVNLLIMAIMLLVSMYATFDLAFSAPRLIAIVYGMTLLFSTVGIAGSSRRAFFVVLAVFVVLGVGIAGISLLGTQFPQRIPIFRTILNQLPGQLTQATFNPNQVAGVLLWIAPLTVWLTFHWVRDFYKHRQNLLIGVVLSLTSLFLVGVLLLTQSRGGILGLGLGLVLTAIFVFGKRQGVAKWLVPIVSVVVLAVVILAWISSDTTLADASSAELSDISTISSRVEIWSRAIYGIRDFPITGMGVNTFRRVVPILYPLFTISPTIDIAHAHNQFLQVALDLGILGLVAFVGVWVNAGIILKNCWGYKSDNWLQIMAVGFTASLIGYLFYGMFDAVTLGAKPSFLFWMLLGLIGGLHQLVAREAPDLIHLP